MVADGNIIQCVIDPPFAGFTVERDMSQYAGFPVPPLIGGGMTSICNRSVHAGESIKRRVAKATHYRSALMKYGVVTKPHPN